MYLEQQCPGDLNGEVPLQMFIHYYSYWSAVSKCKVPKLYIYVTSLPRPLLFIYIKLMFVEQAQCIRTHPSNSDLDFVS